MANVKVKPLGEDEVLVLVYRHRETGVVWVELFKSFEKWNDREADINEEGSPYELITCGIQEVER